MKPGSSIKVNNDNIDEIKASILSLIKNKDKLIENMQEYPLQIDFAKYRVTLCKNIELEELITSLQNKVQSFFKNEN